MLCLLGKTEITDGEWSLLSTITCSWNSTSGSGWSSETAYGKLRISLERLLPGAKEELWEFIRGHRASEGLPTGQTWGYLSIKGNNEKQKQPSFTTAVEQGFFFANETESIRKSSYQAKGALALQNQT